MRYAGQAFELPVPGPPDPDPADLVERFERAHEDLYGHRDPDGDVVLVHIGVAMVSPGPRPRPAAAGGAALEEGSRPVRFGGDWVDDAGPPRRARRRHRGGGPRRLRAPRGDLRRPARLVGPGRRGGHDPGGGQS